eukprot:scaffold108267_cov67-Cyclotella_meneghiniana.AAC.3
MLFKSTLVAMLAYTSSAKVVESDLAQSAVKGIGTEAVEGIQLRGAASAIDFNKLELDINQKVFIDGVEVLGPDAGEGLLNKCSLFDDATVKDLDRPVFKVCGTGIKATVFLRGQCQSEYGHVVVGDCDKGKPPSTCATMSPAENPRYYHYRESFYRDPFAS